MLMPELKVTDHTGRLSILRHRRKYKDHPFQSNKLDNDIFNIRERIHVKLIDIGKDQEKKESKIKVISY
jgi:hypothetical protein